jgi:hypothetical protein
MNTMIALPIAAALPVAAPAMPSTADQGALDDGALLKLEEQIFEHKEAISKLEPEAERLILGEFLANEGVSGHG